MASNNLYYGGIIPDSFFSVWYSDIKKWYDANLYNQMARRLLSKRDVDPMTEEYGITLEDITSNDVEPKARNVAGDVVSVAGSDKSYKVFRWPTGFTMHEDAIQKDPRLQSRHVEACRARISYSEDKTAFFGRTPQSIVGIQAAARANPNGVIAAGSNGGAWLSSDGSRDVYQDVLDLRGKIAAKYRSDRRALLGLCNSTTADVFDQKDPYNDNSTPISASVCSLFGRSPGEPINNWLVVNDQVPSGYFYIIVKRPEVAELVEANPFTLDDNYPREPIGNLRVVAYQDVGIAIHDYYGFAELDVT
jgi:hypothetical protein